MRVGCCCDFGSPTSFCRAFPLLVPAATNPLASVHSRTATACNRQTTLASPIHRRRGKKKSTSGLLLLFKTMAHLRVCCRELGGLCRRAGRTSSRTFSTRNPTIDTETAARSPSRCYRQQPPRPYLKFRSIHTTASALRSRRGGPSEPTPTDINELNVLGDMPPPATSVDVCMYDGFGLNSGLTISGGDGALLVSGEAFSWRPWTEKGSMKLVNDKGQFELPREAFGVFDVLWPRPGKEPFGDFSMIDAFSNRWYRLAGHWRWENKHAIESRHKSAPCGYGHAG